MPQKKNRITISEVAKYAQVSTMTVSRVVNNRGQVSPRMRQHVHQAMRELGYKPNRVARSLASDRTYKIGVIVPNIASMYFTRLLDTIEQTLWTHNYHMVLSNTGRNNRREQDVLDVLEQDRVDGVLIFGSHLNRNQLTHLLKNQRAAVVFNGEVDPKIAGQILFDEHNAIRMAVEYLISVQRTHLGYIGVDKRTYSMRERRIAFENAIDTLGDQVQGWVTDSDGHNLEERLCTCLESNPQTDGLLCFNDETAADVMMILAEQGKRVPDDIAVIGYDDVKVAQWLTPQLTTIRLKKNTSELGELAAMMVLDRIEGKVDDQPQILAHELVVRDSTP